MYPKHSIEQLVDWTRQLRYFRYVRQPREPETVEARWLYKDNDEIKRFADHLGFKINIFDEKPEQPIRGVGYRDLERFASLIPETRWWGQPGS